MTTYQVWIDRQLGTWGMQNDLVFAELTEEQVNELETKSNSELIQVAYKWEEAQR